MHYEEKFADVQRDTDEGYDVHAYQDDGFLLRSRDEAVDPVGAWEFGAEYRSHYIWWLGEKKSNH